MPDPAFDQSDTTLSWPRDLLAAHLGIALAANDPGQLLLRYGLTSFAAASQAAQEIPPPEVSCDLPGLSDQKRHAGAQVALLFPPALAFIYLLLAAQFESFEDPVIVFVTVRFAIVRALPTLIVVPLVYSSIFSQTRATLPEPAASHPQTASSGGLVAVLGE
jgi:hypothetical protein